MTTLERFKHVESLSDCALIAQIIVASAIMPFLAARVSLPRLLEMLNSRNSCQTCDEDRLRKIVLFTRFILSLRIPVFRNTCLIRSLVLFRFLTAAGMDVCFTIGVKRLSETLVAHSWLTTRDGACISDKSEPEDFHVMYTLIAGQNR